MGLHKGSAKPPAAPRGVVGRAAATRVSRLPPHGPDNARCCCDWKQEAGRGGRLPGTSGDGSPTVGLTQRSAKP